MGKAQGCGQFKGGAPGILGERAVEARRDPRREGRGPLHCGGDGPGGWGHGVSGSGRLRVLRSQAPTGGPGSAVRERVTRWGERGGAGCGR